MASKAFASLIFSPITCAGRQFFRSFSINPLRCRERAPSTAPKNQYNAKDVRHRPQLYAKNCVERNHTDKECFPYKIAELFNEQQQSVKEILPTRQRISQIERELPNAPDEVKPRLISEARRLKEDSSAAEVLENQLGQEIEDLIAALPNNTSKYTPRGDRPKELLCTLHDSESSLSVINTAGKSHVDIGTDLGLLDFPAAATTSGWGWYYLKNEGALLEQALIQYTLKIAMDHGFEVVTPPSMVYSHIASACGFKPRDQNGEQQVYTIQQSERDQAKNRASYSLAGTAEIPFASMKANATLDPTELPIKIVGPSRCYRAEAGARGADTKGLYRVHEFTKVEMFAWTSPGKETAAFTGMTTIQQHIISALNLPYRLLEMPSHDLGAAAFRKQDIEVFFPSRKHVSGGWGEVTSTSICTDYQTRRLNTRIKGNKDFPSTINGTALAVPRVLAALLENGWDSTGAGCVRVPEVLWPWMHGIKTINRKR
ncbi:Serine--tRNA ligase, mitochondrial [Puttea exsequens]|nr:Serine--tRNA ligase, mitochondrial [Puttea exsequens]